MVGRGIVGVIMAGMGMVGVAVAGMGMVGVTMAGMPTAVMAEQHLLTVFLPSTHTAHTLKYPTGTVCSGRVTLDDFWILVFSYLLTSIAAKTHHDHSNSSKENI